MDSEKAYQQVQDHYGSVARAQNSSYSNTIAKAFGYSEEELNSIPKDANLGLSCGNPLAIASLREGETVIDLGSGAGFDIFLASKKVGTHGRAIGVDRNKDMLARARENLAKSPGTENTSFVEANITSVPFEDGVADCIISNCVVNLVPDADKPAVFAEMARLLKPGGRIAISDILARKTLSEELRESVALYVSCVAGASLREEYEQWLKENGFGDIVVVDTESDLNVYIDMEKDDEGKNGDAVGFCVPSAEGNISSVVKIAECCSKGEGIKKPCCDTSNNTVTTDLRLADIDINEWVGSFKIFAAKI